MHNQKVIDSDVGEIIARLGKEIYLFENKNILIAGASGMLGRYLVFTFIDANKRLFKKPAKLYLLVRSKKEIFGKDKNIHYLHVDISTPLPKIKDLHFIIHSASKSAPKNYMENKLDTLNANILGTYNLLSLATKSLEGFLYFSSGEVYGNPESEKPINEKYVGRVSNLNMRSCYAEGKRAGETICMNYFWEKGLPVKIARIFHTFGPGINLTDGRIFSDFINDGLKKQNIKILGNPLIKRPLLYLKDATIMFLLLLTKGKNGEVYNVANPRNSISVGRFAEIVCEEFNKYYHNKLIVQIEKNKAKTYYKHAVKTQNPDIAKLKKELGYIPTTSVEEAVAKTVSYYLSKDK